MNIKTHKINHLSALGIATHRPSSKRLAKNGHLARPTLSKPRLKRFAHEYNLPIAVSVIFIFVVFGVAILRASERSALIELLPSISEINQEYSSLLSGDKADEFKKRNDNNDTAQPTTTNSAPNPIGTSSSFALNSGATTSSGGSASTGGGTTLPFSSSLASFQQSGVALECTGSKQNKGNCSKRYTFNASVRTSNGPGTVSYSWRSNLSSANQDANFSAGGGTVVTPLQKQVVIACTDTASYTLQIVVNSPTPTQSSILSISHNCNDI
jgi:hypothetical protein